MSNSGDESKNSVKAKENQADGSESVVLNAMAMALGTMTSRVLGLMRDQLFSALFPLTVRDAWAAAFRIPNMFRRILGEGALSVSFIPVFVEARVQEPSGVRSQNLVNSLYSILLIILTVITALGVLFPEIYMNWLLAPEYSSIPGKLEITIRMTRIMFLFLYFISTYAFFMGILNALGKFALAAMAPTFFNIAMIVSTLWPWENMTAAGDAIAWGVVVGGAIQALILIPSLRRHGYLPRLSFDFTNKDSLRVLRNMIPGMMGLAVLQISTVVNLRFASQLGEGPISYIYLADRLLELPLALVSVSLGTALLPTLSKQWAMGSGKQMAETSNYYIRLNLFVVVPAAVGLYFLALPIVQILFQHGMFSERDSQITASVVEVWALVMIASSCVRVLVPAFYAIKNTWLPAAVSAVCLVVHIVVAPILMKEWGLRGLNFSSFLSSTLNFALLAIAFGVLIGSMKYLKLLANLLKFVLAATGMAFVCRLYDPLLQVFVGGIGGNLEKWTLWRWSVVSLGVIISLSALTYVLLSYLLKVEELQQTWATLGPKIRRRFMKR